MNDHQAVAVTAKPDTPVHSPPDHLDRIKALVGDLARPFAIYCIASCTGAAIVGGATADKVGAAGLLLATLAGAKAWENAQAAKQDATVKVAQAGAAS